MKTFSIASDITCTSHLLQQLLPRRTKFSYSLRSRPHNFEVRTLSYPRRQKSYRPHAFPSIPQRATSNALSYPIDFICMLLCFSYCQLDSFCHHFNKVLMYVFARGSSLVFILYLYLYIVFVFCLSGE